MSVGDTAIDVLDGGRRWVWRQVVRTNTGRACARDRSARVLALGLGHVAVAAILGAIAPGLLLVFGPIALGVPHVIADVRYLWFAVRARCSGKPCSRSACRWAAWPRCGR